MANKYKEILIKPIIAENPITLQILGICSALAVTSNLTVTLGSLRSISAMSASVSF